MDPRCQSARIPFRNQPPPPQIALETHPIEGWGHSEPFPFGTAQPITRMAQTWGQRKPPGFVWPHQWCGIDPGSGPKSRCLPPLAGIVTALREDQHAVAQGITTPYNSGVDEGRITDVNSRNASWPGAPECHSFATGSC